MYGNKILGYSTNHKKNKILDQFEFASNDALTRKP